MTIGKFNIVVSQQGGEREALTFLIDSSNKKLDKFDEKEPSSEGSKHCLEKAKKYFVNIAYYFCLKNMKDNKHGC